MSLIGSYAPTACEWRLLSDIYTEA